MIRLVPIKSSIDVTQVTDEYLHTILEMTLEFYKTVGFIEPWISYFAELDDQNIGTCAFKGAPINGRVEIAYHTFPQYEGKGYATQMCNQLIHIARREDDKIIITARTLPETNASTRILTKSGFCNTGIVSDPEDGDVFEWVLKA